MDCVQDWPAYNKLAHALLTETVSRISGQSADAFGASPFSMRESTSRPARVR